MNRDAPAAVAAAILAGGQSKRLGEDKRVLRLPNGSTLCGRVLGEWLSTEIDWAWVGPLPEPLPSDWPLHQSQQSPRKLSIIADHASAPESQSGPLAGLAAALEWAHAGGADGCLILAVDLPLLKREHLQQLLKAWQARPNQVVAARSSNGFEPLCAVYPTSLLAQAVQALRTDIRSPKQFVQLHKHEVHTISLENRASEAQVMGCVTDAQPRFGTIHPCFNLNRPKDQEIFFHWLEQGLVQ